MCKEDSKITFILSTKKENVTMKQLNFHKTPHTVQGKW